MSALLFFQVSDVGSEKLFSPTAPKGKSPAPCAFSLGHARNNNWVVSPNLLSSNPAALIQI